MAHIPSEKIIQIQIVEFIRQTTDIPIIHIPNEGKRSFLDRYLLGRMGIYPGASDLFFPRGNHEFKGFWMEVKSEKGKMSPLQKLFIEVMIKEGYAGICVWDSITAINFIKEFYSLTERSFATP